MDSKEINEELSKLDSTQDEKHIFYWGWYWRDVDFDDYSYSLATNEHVVGFCENNKWGYRYLDVTEAECKTLRALIEKAVTTKSQDDFKAVNDFMNNLKR